MLELLNFFSDGLPQQWVKNISDDYGGVLPEFLKYIQFIHIWSTMIFQLNGTLKDCVLMEENKLFIYDSFKSKFDSIFRFRFSKILSVHF